MLKNIIILNFSNIKLGGALQVALSFLMELNENEINRFKIIVSQEIFDELIFLEFKFLNKLKIYNSSIFKFLKTSFLPHFREANLIFTLFGPFYGFSKAKKITGFAQAWILFPDNLVSQNSSIFNKLKWRIKFNIQKSFFKKDDILIVETDVSKKLLIQNLKNENVVVVKNALNKVFLDYMPKIKEKENIIKIGVIGRNYLHKNLKILPEIYDLLRGVYNQKISFYVTLTQKEFSNMSISFREKIENYGTLKIYECPEFYKKMDLIFFPSLLETFSATPLESLYMKKPFICTDLPFNKGFLEDYAFYCNPNDVKNSAKIISNVIELLNSNDISLINKLNLGSEYVKKNYESIDRTSAYLKIIKSFE